MLGASVELAMYSSTLLQCVNLYRVKRREKIQLATKNFNMVV
jgi:hypothetical protein